MEDPRPDLAYDSPEWTVFLTMAEKVDVQLAELLKGFRGGGLRLHKESKGYVLRPEFDPHSSTWETPEEYAEDRQKWLVPHTEMIIRLLDRLTVIDEKSRRKI